MHERSRFSFKHPFAQAMVSLIKCMVPEQDGEVAEKFQDMKTLQPIPRL